jgi:hypothetical protein
VYYGCVFKAKKEIPVYFRSDHFRDELFALRDLVVLTGRTGCLVAPYPAQNRGFVELDYCFQIQHTTNDVP